MIKLCYRCALLKLSLNHDAVHVLSLPGSIGMRWTRSVAMACTRYVSGPSPTATAWRSLAPGTPRQLHSSPSSCSKYPCLCVQVLAVWKYDKREVNGAPVVYFATELRAAPPGTVEHQVRDHES